MPASHGPALPRPRGPLSADVVDHLAEPVHPAGPFPPADPADGDDFHLALYVLYELHYRGFAGHLLDSWRLGRSSLRTPVGVAIG